MSVLLKRSYYGWLSATSLVKTYPCSNAPHRQFCQHVTGPVRVRFAPSPTGFIHLGGLRTALYNYLFAKKHNGTFILRIEDTDQKRIVPGSLENIIDTLKWSQLVPDEGPTFGGKYGPYIQSERVDLYKEMVNHLFTTKSVYRCFCSPKRLELLRREAAKNRETIRYDNICRSLTEEEVKANLANDKPYTIRLKLKEGPMTVNDLVYGNVSYDLSRSEGDPILIKSDGMPTYHFANVVDDHFMQISHVFRGREWLESTPKHLMLYEAFGWKAPQFAHLPLIVNENRTKLSKRNDDLQINRYRREGFFPDVVYNCFTQIGGGFGSLTTLNEHRIYSLAQLSEAFCLEKVHNNSCRLSNLNFKFLNRLLIEELCHSDMKRLTSELQIYLSQDLFDQQDQWYLEDTAYLGRVIKFALKSIGLYSLKELTSTENLFVWSPPKLTWQPTSIASTEVIARGLRETIDFLRSLTEDQFEDEDLIKAKLNNFHQDSLGQEETLKYGPYLKLLRFALTNLKVGPPAKETMPLLGKQRSIQYLERALEYVILSDNTQEQTSIKN